MATVVSLTYKNTDNQEVKLDFESLSALHTWKNNNSDKKILSETFKPHVYDFKCDRY